MTNRKELNLYYRKSSDRSENFTISVESDGRLVFNQGVYYPRLTPGGESREYDEYLGVRTADKDQLLLQLLQFLFEEGYFKDLTTLKKWLSQHSIPFEENEWFSLD
jgi:hypothetical protein